MDVYKIDAKVLEVFIKNQQKITNLKKPNAQEDNNISIDSNYIPKLCFNETLAIVNENDEELGVFIGKIRPSSSNTTSPSIMINLYSTNISQCGKETGINVVTTTTTDFYSYTEKWSQWCSMKSEIKRKTVLISNKNTSETTKIYTEWNNRDLNDQNKKISMKYIENLLTEGMNYAFLRYLAIIGFEGSIKNKMAVTINGILCKTIYVCFLKEKHKIYNEYTQVVIIKRVLQDEISKNTIDEITTVLTRSGHILKHFWSKTTKTKLIVKKPMKITKNLTKNTCVYYDTLLNLKNGWEQDIWLKSMYLDNVSELKIKYNNYIKNNREVKDMIANYVTEILVTKPDNVFQFSINYFEGLK